MDSKNFDPLNYLIAQNIMILAQNNTIIRVLEDQSPDGEAFGQSISGMAEEEAHQIANATLRTIGGLDVSATAEISSILKSLYGMRFYK